MSPNVFGDKAGSFAPSAFRERTGAIVEDWFGLATVAVAILTRKAVALYISTVAAAMLFL